MAAQEEWPEVYWNALRELSGPSGGGGRVVVPQPHPKFSVSDMQRIAAAGPRFEDLVLEHAERIYDPGGWGVQGGWG